MDSKQAQVLGYTREPTSEQISALAKLNEVYTELNTSLVKIRTTPGIDTAWLQVGQQNIAQSFLALRQAIVPVAQFELYMNGKQTLGLPR